MIQVPGAEEIGKTTRSFFEILRESPLSLALVGVICGLIVLLYFSQTQTLEQRRETSALIIAWQRDTDKLMANCVSADVTKMVLDNLERTTQTMLAAEQKEIGRMQQAINEERERNNALTQRLLDALTPSKPAPQSFTQPKPIDYQECDPLGPFCMPI